MKPFRLISATACASLVLAANAAWSCIPLGPAELCMPEAGWPRPFPFGMEGREVYNGFTPEGYLLGFGFEPDGLSAVDPTLAPNVAAFRRLNEILASMSAQAIEHFPPDDQTNGTFSVSYVVPDRPVPLAGILSLIPVAGGRIVVDTAGQHLEAPDSVLSVHRTALSFVRIDGNSGAHNTGADEP